MSNWMYNGLIPENIIVSSEVSLRRNFKNSYFKDRLSIENLKNNVEEIYNMLKDKLSLSILRLWEEDDITLKMYNERSIVSDKLLEEKSKGAVILNSDGKLSIIVNEEDDLRIRYISNGFSLKSSYESISKVDDIIEENLSYAFSEKYGYLTSNLDNVGTGLNISVILHLPAITMQKGISKLFSELKVEGIKLEALYMDGEHTYGNLYEISNKITIGLTEEDIIHSLEKAAVNICMEEKRQREILQTKYKYDIEDKIFRSYGILRSARILKSSEALELLSNVMFGVEMSLLEIDKELLYNLIIETRDAVIQERIGRTLENKELDIERARIVSSLI